MTHSPIYGLDIESDTSIDGLDPTNSSIVAVAVAGEDWTSVLHASDLGERGVLLALERTLRSLPSGLLATWNGARFDLPFLADRAGAVGVELSLELREDRLIEWRNALPGHQGGYEATWGAHQHVDGYQLYRSDVGRVVPISCGLKSVARFVGLHPIEVDRARIHELSRDALDEYVASDAELALELVRRRVGVGRIPARRDLNREAPRQRPLN